MIEHTHVTRAESQTGAKQLSHLGSLAGWSSCALLALLPAVGVVAGEAQRDVLLDLREGDGSLLRSVEGLRGVHLVLGVALEAVLVGALATTDTLVSVLAAEVELELAEDLDLDLTNSPVRHGERIRAGYTAQG